MSLRSRWLICVAAGLVVLGVVAVMGPMFPTEGAGYEPGFGVPVIAFEMARSPEDLVKVFGSVDDPERAGRIAAMDQGNRWDYAFMVVYGVFIWSFFDAVRRETGQEFWLIFAVLGVLASVTDAIENVILLDLTSDLEAARNVQWLAYPVWTKFLSLMIAGLGAGASLIARRHWFWSFLGVIMICGALTVSAGFVSPETYAWMMGNGMTIVWLSQLAFAAVRSWSTPTSESPPRTPIVS